MLVVFLYNVGVKKVGSMKLLNEINGYKKEWVYDNYVRIIYDFKKYDNISRVKALEEIYKEYSNPHVIVDLCLTKEIDYLEKILTKGYIIYDFRQKIDKDEEWIRKTLLNKFLVTCDFHNMVERIVIPEEIIDYVREAVSISKNIKRKGIDEITEFSIGFLKTQGNMLLGVLKNMIMGIYKVPEEKVNEYFESKIFNYYAFRDTTYINGNEVDMIISIDYYEISDNIDRERRKQGLVADASINVEKYKNIFYYDFDISNPKISKFLKELDDLPFWGSSALKDIKYFAMLNRDRQDLKDAIRSVPALKNVNLTSFFKTMDEAMDEMPSGALNGFSKNEAKEIKAKQAINDFKKNYEYTPQKNARIDKRDVKLFYKLYNALMEYVNNKYNIIPNLKICNAKGLKPEDIHKIIVKLWEDINIIDEFCLNNPYKLNSTELKMVKEFKRGIRANFILAKYEDSYTCMIHDNKIYMVKGLTCNIDEVVSNNCLPTFVETTILPFKNNIIYDSIISQMPVSFGCNFSEIVERDLNRLEKIYKL